MNEIQLLANEDIKRHNFDKYKEDLKKFSEKADNDFEIPKVETESWLVFDHKVTGDELNSVTRKIGEHLIELNKNQIELTKEFRVIYEAFESLDKDYISGILSSLKSAEIAFNNSVYAIEELQKTQKDIELTINVQKRIIKGLSDFNETLNANSHLDDIDVMWENTQYMMNAINELSNKLNNLEQEKNSLLLKNKELVDLIKSKKDESKKIQNLSIATAILFVFVVVNFAVNYLR